MSFLSPSTFLGAGSHGAVPHGRVGGGKDVQTLRSRSSIAAIVNIVRDPVGSVAGAVDAWYERDRAANLDKQITDGKKRVLYLRLQESASYNAWKTAADELDQLEDNNAWKAIDRSPHYDSDLVAARLRQLEEARQSRDLARMVFLIRTALTRDLGNMGNVELYKHSHIGTKNLIDKYIDSTLDTLNVIIDMSTNLPEKGPLSHRGILEQVISARQAFGRSALLLSGGGTFGMSHNGVLKCLWEHKLLPRIISGASAGSIVSAIMCTRTDDEIPDLLEQFCHGDLAVFEEEGNEEGYVKKAARFLKHGHLYDISHLTRVMRDSLGDMTFQEGYNRTRRILNICVSSAGLYELPRLLNYVTAPNVVIWSAVAASCSVPVIFSPAQLLAKDSRTGELIPWDPSPQRWIDGSVDNDLPMTRLAEMFNVNHFIVSQVNPHVVPFLGRDEGLVKASDDSAAALPGFKPSPTWLHTATHLAKGEALYRLKSMADLGIFPNALTKAASILNQKYSGDITILPAIAFQDFPLILKNPTEEFMIKSALMGERATWPKLSRVRNHCAIELALDDAVQRLRTRVVFSSSQVDLRQDAYSQAKLAAKRKRVRHHRENSDTTKQAISGRPLHRTKRTMSQSSEPDASLFMATRGIKPSGRPGSSASGNSGHSTFSERRPHGSMAALSPVDSDLLDAAKSSQLNRVRPARPVSFQLPPSPTTPKPRANSGRVTGTGVPDISSGAETSGVFTTDDEDDDGAESDGSVTSTDSQLRESPTGSHFFASDWQMKPNEQDLFPHASQPPTPLIAPGYRPFSLTFTPASPPGKPFADGNTTNRPNKGKKEKRVQISGPELRYKQLFHGASRAEQEQSDAKAATSNPSSRSDSEGRGKTRKVNALGIEISLPSRRKPNKELA